MWEGKQAELRSFSHPTLFYNSVAEKFPRPLRLNTPGSGRATGNGCPAESAWEAQSRAVLPLCSGHPARAVLSLGSRGLALSFLPVWLLGGSQSWCPCPATTGLAGSGVPHNMGKDITVTLHGSSQSRPKMSIRSIQPSTVAWMVLGGSWVVNHAPLGRAKHGKKFC